MQSLLAFLHSRPGRVLRYLCSLALLGTFVAGIDWGQLAGTRGRFAPGPAAAALLLAGVTYPLHAWRWWLLYRPHGLRLGLAWAHWVTWIGQFYNSFLLGGLGGDAARVFYICRDEPRRRAGGLASITLDRVMGLVVLMSIAALALVAKSGTVAREPGLRWILIVALGVTVGGALAAGWLLATDPGRWPAPLRRLLGERGLGIAGDLIAGIRSSPRDHLLAILSSYAIWLLDIIAVWLLADAVGLRLPFVETCIAVAVAYAATALPISVGGHGVREGAMLAVLGLFGLVSAGERDAALLLALLVWAVTVFWSLVGGLVLLAAARLLPPRLPASGSA